ncbi:DNA ligase I, ATP-dependent Dnl1 [Vulcanisaeta moutnovskia 768-28]|uniref:DNA ligase n=1 Tax=Vulcanisaeta moutnovskia (strain 768-28) TaxID=985053 RepID=F0QSG1_VULM7|nr:DNA ligase I, ATP-dependent Dnl1 [Vulcanisaeta moutnovskia 768-28]
MSSGNDIKFIDVVRVLESIEATTQRTVMAKLLSSLLKKTPPDVIDKVIYFILGQLRPDWEGVELGVAEKFTFRAIANATGASVKQVEDLYKKIGDIGETAKRIMSSKPQQGGGKSILEFFGGGGIEELTMGKVYDTLMSIAKASGEGAQDTKVKLLIYLFSRAKPEEAKYIARFVIGRLRLGVADMTILDALSDAYKVSRDALERAYHIYPDLGYIAKMVAQEGQNALSKIHVTPGVPIQPMLAERLSTAAEILAKLGGTAMVEYKYDGERAQVHRTRDGEVRIFSRRLENITYAYPDVAEYVKEAIDAKEYIVEGEIIAIDPDTGEFRPFQELMHRKRKHDVKEAMKEYPVNIFLFDVMYVDGQDLTNLPLIDRKRRLLEILKPSEYVHLATWRVINDAEELDKFFHEAISDGCEGVMCKSIKADSIYEMGARGWLWIKYKRDYRSELTDTLDLVVVGAFWGRGKRAGTYGALLIAAYDPKTDQFYTVSKVGSGFTDEDLVKLKQMLDPYRIPHRHPRVVSKMEPDVWFVPAVVLEIIGAEITLSPLHTCCVGSVRSDVGLAIRFPRFTGRYRTDKSPEQATTVDEILEMYKEQKKVKVEEGPNP